MSASSEANGLLRNTSTKFTAATEVRVDANEQEKFEAWWRGIGGVDGDSDRNAAWLSWHHRASLASAPRAAEATVLCACGNYRVVKAQAAAADAPPDLGQRSPMTDGPTPLSGGASVAKP